MAGAVILNIAYGYAPAVAANDPDPLVDIAETALDIFSRACVPGVWAVDVFPGCECRVSVCYCVGTDSFLGKNNNGWMNMC